MSWSRQASLSIVYAFLLASTSFQGLNAQTTPTPTPHTPPTSGPAHAPPPAVPPPVAAAARPPAAVNATPPTVPPTRAPTTAPTVATTPPTQQPSRAPTNGQILNTVPSPSVARVPGGAITPSLAQAPAPGPLSGGTVNSTVSILSPGALSTDQQQQLCGVLVPVVRNVSSGVNSCSVTSQTPSTSANTATNGRRLQQSTTTLVIGLAFSSASTSQTAAIQNALNGVVISIGSTTTTITVISIVFVPGQITINGGTTPPPTNVQTLSSTTTITITTGSTSTQTVITVVPTNAQSNTTNNSPAPKPTTPTGGTSTTTTITNSTHTTTTITIAVFTQTTQITQITQYFFTVIIGQTTGILTIRTFGLNGNVVNNLPVSVTGGAVTGQTRTITVTGVTVQTIQTTSITTSSTTTSSTSTSTSTTTGQTTSSTTGGTTVVGGSNTTTPTTITGVTRQVCKVPNNPYGLIQNTANEGTLVKGAFLVSSWNDVANNNPGQGNLIYQCFPNGTTTVWSNVTISGACTRDKAGVGLTMALSRCGNIIIVGSLPILPGGNANPGCLIALDLTGKTINEVTSPGINGPWGSVCTSSGNQITLALSSVLGGLAPSNSTTGRRLLQAPASGPSASVTGGSVVKWTFDTPTSASWSLGTPTFLVTGIKTNGSQGVAGGAVGPGGLTIDNSGTLYIPDNLGNRILALPNGLSTGSAGQATPLTVTNNGINGPNSVTFGNGNQLLGTNTADGKLFFITLNSNRNGGTGSLLQVDPGNTAGVLFQAIFSTDSAAGAPLNSIWFQHDGSNTLNTVISSGSPALAPGSRPSSAPTSGAPTTGK